MNSLSCKIYGSVLNPGCSKSSLASPMKHLSSSYHEIMKQYFKVLIFHIEQNMFLIMSLHGETVIFDLCKIYKNIGVNNSKKRILTDMGITIFEVQMFILEIYLSEKALLSN